MIITITDEDDLDKKMYIKKSIDYNDEHIDLFIGSIGITVKTSELSQALKCFIK